MMKVVGFLKPAWGRNAPRARAFCRAFHSDSLLPTHNVFYEFAGGALPSGASCQNSEQPNRIFHFERR